MAQARGVATAIQIWNETSYGVKPGSPSGERIYFKTSSVGASIGRVTDDGEQIAWQTRNRLNCGLPPRGFARSTKTTTPRSTP